jgi:hypothetical protein
MMIASGGFYMNFRVFMAASGALAICLAGCLGSDPLDQSTTEQPVINDPTQTSYNLGVLVLKFIPTADGVNIDTSVTGDVSGTVAAMRAKTDSITANLVNLLSAGSAYHKYSNSSAPPSLTFHVVDTHEWDSAVPTAANPHYNGTTDMYRVRPDYNQIMNNVSICNYVQNQGVNEVWIYAYQGPTQLEISESEMSGPHGDISNSFRDNVMPVCSKTYTVYTFNESRGTAEAVHSHGHQYEAEFNYVSSNIFTNEFEGPAHPGGTSSPGRCGSVHNPPNSTAEYDYADTTAHATDCPSWLPDGLGPTTQMSCTTWGCADVSDTHNAQLNWLVFWMQNIPAKGNTIQTSGHHMRNWWDVHANWDSVVSSSNTLTVDFPCSGSVCDNLDPTASFSSSTGAYCSANATTASGASISADGGTLEMRWGPNCSVNWARFTPSSSGHIYYIWVGRQSPGFNAYGYEFTGTAGVQYFSNQVYAPGPAQVCVLEWNGSAWGNQVCTNWI